MTAKAKSADSAEMNFTVANGQFRGACFALAPLEALKRSVAVMTQKTKAGPKTVAAVLDLGPLDRRSCDAQKPHQRMLRRVELIVDF